MQDIEGKDVTITPIKRKENIIFNTRLPAKRKIGDVVVNFSSMRSPKEIHIESQSPANVHKPATEELLSGNALLRSADITVQEILDWANNNKISQAAVNELLQVLRVKRIKTEKSESPTKSNESQPTVQREFCCCCNVFDGVCHILINRFSVFSHSFTETVGLYTRIIQRLEGMEKNLLNRISILERKVDSNMKNIQK